MSRKYCTVTLAALLLLALPNVAPSLSTPPVPGGEISDRLAEAVNFYVELDFDKGLAVTDELIARKNLTASDSIAIYEVKSIITYAKGQKFKREAFGYLKYISDIGHCLIHLPREIWPSELRDKWYQLSKNKNLLVCPQETEPEIQTIAIMEFDNFSVGKYKDELGDLSKALADFFEYDFSFFSGLKVVERDKLDYLIRELDLVKEGKVEQASAVRAGKMLGAQLMVFGSIAQLDKKNARMVVRVVKVETSEIITSADREGKPNFVEMEKELVKDLAGKLNVIVTEDIDTAIEESATSDMDAAKLYSLGLKYMDSYEYEKAYEFFKKAYEKDNNFLEAKRKMEIYKPLIS